MRKFIAAIVMTGLVGHAFAQSQPLADQNQNTNGAAAVPCIATGGNSTQDDQPTGDNDRRRDGAALLPCSGAAGAAAAAAGNLSPLYVGASVVGVAVIAGALSGGGDSHHSSTSGTGGTTGTTGTH
jgi:hypothetical protein